jgi:hypothetical protein
MITTPRPFAVRVALGGLAGLAARAAFHFATSGSPRRARRPQSPGVREPTRCRVPSLRHQLLRACRRGRFGRLLLAAALVFPRRVSRARRTRRATSSRSPPGVAAVRRSRFLYCPRARDASPAASLPVSPLPTTRLLGRSVVLFLVLFVVLVPRAPSPACIGTALLSPCCRSWRRRGDSRLANASRRRSCRSSS